VCYASGMEKHEAPAAYEVMREALNERQWRLYLAVEAKKRGRGGISAVAREAHATRGTIRKGLAEIESGQPYVEGARIRRSGGGRKRLSVQDPTPVPDLEALLDPKGDPMSLLKWTTKSVGKLCMALREQGHAVAETTVRRLLRAHDYTLQANKKAHEGAGAPDRDGQFAHIKEACAQFEAAGDPIISVGCTKKELLGDFKNNGREWQPQGQPATVNAYDFLSLADGKAIPYGVYDVLRNTGFVNVGHAGHDLQGDADVVVGGASGKAECVVQEDLVRAGLDQEGRQAGEAGVDRADQTVRGVGTVEVVGGAQAQGGGGDDGVDIGLGGDAVPGGRQVYPGR